MHPQDLTEYRESLRLNKADIALRLGVTPPPPHSGLREGRLWGFAVNPIFRPYRTVGSSFNLHDVLDIRPNGPC